eukprot:TRINITY_DN75391_c0_g1_i1.p1 TRINITY_DN75391_c0_g1~~TRINITY_DN75391_c0_g1_i1.p1  ORF type:complete len:603 (-),score=96.68 TRINITY_DN75391_c0_g1_i1:54-1862(-)
MKHEIWFVLCAVTAPVVAVAELLSAFLMADIGHSREHADILTSPWPMNKCALEGAFSLYEGLADYVVNQGVHAQAVFIIGDVSYGGGSVPSNNATRATFQKYLFGTVPADMVFPAIGNHDINYLGCAAQNVVLTCYYGSSELLFEAEYAMTYQDWQASWMEFFPGLNKTGPVVVPPPLNDAWEASWTPPTRYNVNLGDDSAVYFIIGLMTGSWQLRWQADTPNANADAMLDEFGQKLECRFVAASIANARRLGKRIFVYMTHHFDKGCTDWNIMQHIDLWVYGHKHNMWTSTEINETIIQEARHYPARLLIGNGGFDEGHINLVSFAHLTEERIEGDQRVRLNVKVLNTCESAGTCPDNSVPIFANCWKSCKNVSGGYDGGGGPRKAIPHKDIVFRIEAPRFGGRTVTPWDCSSWQLRVRSQHGSGQKYWLGLSACTGPQFNKMVEKYLCLSAVKNWKDAVSFSMYAASWAGYNKSRRVVARLAINDDLRAPIVHGILGSLLKGYGFWEFDKNGEGRMWPSRAFHFDFFSQGDPAHPPVCMQGGVWTIRGFAWNGLNLVTATDTADEVADEVFDVEFHPVTNGGAFDVFEAADGGDGLSILA